MTIILDYEISEKRDPGATGPDLRSADEITLRYDCFLGDVVFRVGEADFSARWGWVPVLDFAMGLRAILSNLTEGHSQTFEFTESDARIGFKRQGPSVDIEADYAPERAQVSYSDLSKEADQFLLRVIRDLERSHPELAENAVVASLSRELSDGGNGDVGTHVKQ